MTSAWGRIFRGLGLLTVAACLAFAFTPIPNLAAARFGLVPDKAPADAIVVLAAGLLHGGLLDDDSLRRTVAGIDLYKKNLAPIVVLSGHGNRDEPLLTEAEQRSKLAQSMGVPAEAILKEETANTTQEEAIKISRLLMHRGLRKILLVTQSLHLRRAKLVFENTGLEVFAVPSDDYPTAATSPSGRLWLAARLVEESTALLYYRLAGYI